MAAHSPQDIQKALVAKLDMASDTSVWPCRLNFEQRVHLAVDDETLVLAAVRPDGGLSLQRIAPQSILDITASTVSAGALSLSVLLADRLWRLDQFAPKHQQALIARLSRLTDRDLSHLLTASQSTKPAAPSDNSASTALPGDVAIAGDDRRIADPAPSLDTDAQATPAFAAPSDSPPFPDRAAAARAPDEPQAANLQATLSAAQAEDDETDPEAAAETEDDEEDYEEGSPWYATVKGPAIQTYFHEETESKPDSAAGPQHEPEPPTAPKPAAAGSPAAPPAHGSATVDTTPPVCAETQAPTTAPAGKTDDAATEPAEKNTVSTAATAASELSGPGVAAGSVTLDETIAHWRSQIAREPLAVQPYRELCRIFHAQDDDERAFWHAAVLTHFGVAEPVEREIYTQHRIFAPLVPKRPQSQSEWYMALVSPNQDPWPAAFYAVLARPVALHTGRSLRSYGLKRKERCDLQKTKLLLAKVFAKVRTAMGYDTVDLYIDKNAEFELLVANVVERGGRWSPVCVAGASALHDKSEFELTFSLARDLCFLRPEHLLSLLMPDPVDQTFLTMAAMQLVRPKLVNPDDDKTVSAHTKMLDNRLNTQERAILEKLVEDMISRQVPIEPENWSRLAHAACDRAGLLFSQDLATAADIVARTSNMTAFTSPEQRLKGLLTFAVSPQHFEARRRLGITLDDRT
jgi:hypothetical protein